MLSNCKMLKESFEYYCITFHKEEKGEKTTTEVIVAGNTEYNVREYCGG